MAVEDTMGTMGRPEQASTWFLKVLAAACRAHGVDPGPVFESAGVSPELLEARGGRVPLSQARAAWNEAARRSGDPHFGLHAAERLPPGSFDVLDYLGRSMPTLGQMVERICQLASIFTEDGALTLSASPRSSVLRHSARAPVSHVSELIIASVVLRGRELTGVDWTPGAVGFMHRAPADASEHQRIFRAPVRFGQPADELYLAPALLLLPLKTYEPQLSSILDDYIRLVSGRAAAAPAMLTDVSDAISAALPKGEPLLEDIARSLKVTPRTLQRRLHDAGTSFQKLLDHLRHQLALQYREDRNLPTSKLALMLGFSEPSAFYRASKRWKLALDEPPPPPARKRSRTRA
jgi:AraC-like DNA-binding protein